MMIECLSNVLSVVQFCIIAFIPFFKRFWMKGIDFRSVIHALLSQAQGSCLKHKWISFSLRNVVFKLIQLTILCANVCGP